MAIHTYKAYTPSTRERISPDFSNITKAIPQKSLVQKIHRSKGRNNRGLITIRHRGGGHKRSYRIIDFRRNKRDVLGRVSSIEYDPNRNCRIALITYKDGVKRYILHPENLVVGDEVNSGENVSLNVGNALPLKNIPLGTEVHNIELQLNKGGQIARSAGSSAKILAKEANHVTIRLPSKEVRLVHQNCYATIGKLDNSDHMNIVLGKAGRKRWLGKRPRVRGVVMNPCDHPHGGGEGRSPIGKTRPVTPWGKSALGIKTRKKNKYSDIYILKARK
uniref:ribosomal protein L2 n=1 Tax=Haramonas pauciplastida TaxID=478668 RepID=UPI0021159C0E|nr:ribosomal protein L2 [Haramonas pauciplastida]UTE94978.1 ribosomal protein L2 [Haramonas pauciplastida]